MRVAAWKGPFPGPASRPGLRPLIHATTSITPLLLGRGGGRVMLLCWTDDAWADCLYWQSRDRRTLKRVNTLIRDMQRTPFEGIGKPEPLKWGLSGAWSRRIDSANRIIYTVADDRLCILSAKDHY